MIKEYYSAQEIAEISGMSKAGVLKKAAKENWDHRPRKGKGGGKEFHINALPAVMRNQLAKLAAETSVQPSENRGAEIARTLAVQNKLSEAFSAKRREQVVAKVAHLKGAERLRAQSKFVVLGMWQTFVKNSADSKVKASSQFLIMWSQDLLNIPQDQRWIRDCVSPKLSLQTLYSWEKAMEENPERIWGKYGHRKGQTKIDTQPSLREFVIATICEFPHISGPQLFESVETRFSGTDIDIPSKRSLERWVKNYKQENAQAFTAVTSPDKWKNTYMPAFGTLGVVALNEKWELDSTPADIMLSDGRYNLLGAIDVYSRRVKLLVSKTSTAGAVSSLIRECILDWGVPQTVKTDNGADYVSLQIQTAFQGLGIEQNVSAPFSPWEKPHIERFFRTFSHGLLELMPGFIGHNVAERSEIEDRKQFSDRLFKKDAVIEINMSSKDLQTFVDDWIEHLYMHKSHTGEGIEGKTPFQMVSEWTGPIQKIQDARALDILLAEAGERTVGKDGIRLDGFTYIAAELGAIVGEKVAIRKDPNCVGTIYVFMGGEFVCVAEDARYVGIRRQEIAHQAKQNALAKRKELKKEIRSAQSKQKVKDLADEVLQAKREENNVSMLPKRTEDYSNGMLDAAIEAASMTTANVEPVVMKAKPTVVPTVTDAREIYRRWLRLEQRIKAGEQLEQKDLNWFKSYQKTPEWRDMKEFFEEFGLGLEANSN